MTKFRCIKGNCDVPVGTIIEGELSGEYIVLTKDSTILMGEEPIFEKGEPIKLTGYVWQWEQFDGSDKEELLARFEQAIETYRICTELVTKCESEADLIKAKQEYESAKAEVLKRLS